MNDKEELVEGLLTDEELCQFEDDFVQISWQSRQYPNEPVMNFACGLVIQIAEAQLRKVIPIIQMKDAEIAELKEQVEYMHEAWEVLIEVTEAECQEKIARIKGELEEMFEPTVPMSINYEKWHAYWEEKGVK